MHDSGFVPFRKSGIVSVDRSDQRHGVGIGFIPSRPDVYLMVFLVVFKRNRRRRLPDVIEPDFRFRCIRLSGHRNVIGRVPVPVNDIDGSPVRRQAWDENKMPVFQPYAQKRLEDQAVHPAGRSCVP